MKEALYFKSFVYCCRTIVVLNTLKSYFYSLNNSRLSQADDDSLVTDLTEKESLCKLGKLDCPFIDNKIIYILLALVSANAKLLKKWLYRRGKVIMTITSSFYFAAKQRLEVSCEAHY